MGGSRGREGGKGEGEKGREKRTVRERERDVRLLPLVLNCTYR